MDRETTLSRDAGIAEDEQTKLLKQILRRAYVDGISASDFKQLLDALQQRFIIDAAVSMPGNTEGLNFFREGQNNIVRMLCLLAKQNPNEGAQ